MDFVDGHILYIFRWYFYLACLNIIKGECLNKLQEARARAHRVFVIKTQETIG